MAHRISHPWPARMPDRVPYRASGDGIDDLNEDTVATIESERKRKRVWRLLTWIVVTNLLLFWLLTFTTAFAHTTNWVGV